MVKVQRCSRDTVEIVRDKELVRRAKTVDVNCFSYRQWRPQGSH